MRILRTLLFALPLVAVVACGNKPAETAAGDKQCAKQCAKAEQCDKQCAKQCAKAEQCDKQCDKQCKKGCNAVVENIMSRRSVRKYKPVAVPREVLNTIMECGINAPNGMNRQAWEVRVVESAALQGEIKEAMAAVGGERAAGCFYNAPVWVFIARDRSYDFSTIDCGLLAGNMMLAANSLGVGSVCLGSPVRFILDSPQRDAVLQKLGFSEGYELCICLSLGYPDETPAAKPRNAEKVRFVE